MTTLAILHAINVVLFAFFTFVWSSKAGINLIIKMVAFAATIANLLALLVQLGFVVRI